MRFFNKFYCLFLLFAVSPASSSLASEKEKTLVIIGDSLTEGYGVAKDKAYPALLEAELKRRKKESWRIVNSGISGSTAASAPERIKWILRTKPDFILLALGANDGLRGRKAQDIRRDLANAIELAQAAGVRVGIAGMLMPPNYGEKYRQSFAKIFPEVAKEKKIPIIPFLLEGVAGEAKLNQSDGIHPNELGHEKMSKHVGAALEKIL